MKIVFYAGYCSSVCIWEHHAQVGCANVFHRQVLRPHLCIGLTEDHFKAKQGSGYSYLSFHTDVYP